VGDPRCLPSVGRSGYRALRRSHPNLAIRVRVYVHAVVRPSVAFSSRALGRSVLRRAVRDDHPLQSPRPPLTAFARERNNTILGFYWAATAPPISATHVRRAGTPASRESSSARGCRPCPRSRPVSCPTVPPPVSRRGPGVPACAEQTEGYAISFRPPRGGRRPVKAGDDVEEPCFLTTLPAYPLRGRRRFRGDDGARNGVRLGRREGARDIAVPSGMGRAPPSEGHGAQKS